MSTSRILAIASLLLGMAFAAHADNRVAAHAHGPHVGAASVMPMTTPGQCGGGYQAASNKGRPACVSCPAGYKYTWHNSVEACVHCDQGYDYYMNANPQICAGCPAGYIYNPGIGACFPKP